MGSSWTVIPLGECGQWYSGGTPDTGTAKYWNGDIPWISASSLHDFNIRDSERRVTQLGIENGTRLMPAQTILFVVRGMSLKTEFRVGIAQRPVAFGQDCKAIIVRAGIDPTFLAYSMRARAPEILGIADEASHGTGRLQTEALQQLEIDLPPLPEQRAIAAILGALDDKIELNRRMNGTLEAMARALFKSWFVDFDPVRAKMDGRPSGLPAELSALFPEEMEEGRPRGWKDVSIYSVADVIYGAPYSSKLFNTNYDGLPLIRIRDLSTHRPDVYTMEDHPKGTSVYAGDIVVGMDGEFRVHHWRGDVALLNQRMCMFKPKSDVPRYFVSMSIEKPLEFFERSKVGTTVIHLGKMDIDTFRVMLPPKSLLIQFGKISEPLLHRIIENELQSRTLSALRDALLPKLMSGEVRINFDQ